MSDFIISSEPEDENYLRPEYIEYRHKILDEVGGSPIQYSPELDENFGGPEYEHHGEYRKARYQLQSVTNLKTGETLEEEEAFEKVGEMMEWHGGFNARYDDKFQGDRPHEFIVPEAGNDPDHEYRIEYESIDKKSQKLDL